MSRFLENKGGFEVLSGKGSWKLRSNPRFDHSKITWRVGHEKIADFLRDCQGWISWYLLHLIVHKCAAAAAPHNVKGGKPAHPRKMAITYKFRTYPTKRNSWVSSGERFPTTPWPWGDNSWYIIQKSKKTDLRLLLKPNQIIGSLLSTLSGSTDFWTINTTPRKTQM